MQQWVRTSLEQHAFVASKALDQHRAIFVAVAKRNPAKAREAMQGHLDAMAAHLRAGQKTVSIDERTKKSPPQGAETKDVASNGRSDPQPTEFPNPSLTTL